MPRPESQAPALTDGLPESWEIVYWPGRQQPYTLKLHGEYLNDRHRRYRTRGFFATYKEAVARIEERDW